MIIPQEYLKLIARDQDTIVCIKPGISLENCEHDNHLDIRHNLVAVARIEPLKDSLDIKQ